MHLCKNQRHELRVPADFIGTECRACANGRQDRHRARRKDAMALFHRLESRGIRVSELNDSKADRIAAAIEIIENTDPVMLDHLRRLDPDQFARAVANVRLMAERLASDAG